MEKQTPYHELDKFKKLFGRSETRVITTTAQKGAAAMGYMDEDDIETVIGRLDSGHFYKSMTAHHHHKIWQDVYRWPADGDAALYIKLQLSPDREKAVLIQMKKDDKPYQKPGE